MFTNYIKVALRSISRNKLTSFINIVGLAFAMLCSLLIFLYITDELSYDRYNENADRTFRFTREFLSRDGSTSLHLGHLAPPFGPLLKNDFTDFEEICRTLQNNTLLSLQENGAEKKAFNEEFAYYAEPSLFKIFSIDVQSGNPATALTDPYKIMLSEETAKKYFGDVDPIGKQIKMTNTYSMEVSGVYKDFPAQSHWHPDVLISFSTLEDTTIYGRKGLETNFGNNSFGTYALVKEPFDKNKIETQIPAFLDKHLSAMAAQNNLPKPSSFTRLYLQKLTDIHLHSHLDSEEEANGNITNIYMMGVIGLFIILIACFNFINLATAQATKRSKEVGLRKVVGAFKIQLINQYLSESVLIALFSLLLTIGFSWLGIQWLNEFTSKEINLNIFQNAQLTVGLFGFALAVGLLAGLYPAFVISGYTPATVLKGKSGATRGKGGIRKTLVVFQFAISISLMIATAITFQQLDFLNTRELGYDKDQVIVLPLYDDLAPNYDAFYNELTKQTSIKNATRSSRVPTGRLLDSQGQAVIQKGDSMMTADVVIKNIRSDYEYFDTYGIEFASGRNFSKSIKSDDSLGFILNEAAVKMLGVTNDDVLTRDFQYGGIKGRVIGVVKDFHFESLHEEIVPMVFKPSKFYRRLSVKIAGKNSQEAIANIEKTWNSFIPQRPFEFEFLNQQYQKLYESEQKQSKLFTVFSALAILIACLGLFGLASFNTLQRVKEIGIRKALGASLPSILTLLSKEMVILVLIANIVAWPVAWYFMDGWLATFAYRTNFNIGIFILSTFAALFIALATVSSQTIKAARTNPANTLRYE